jgi:ABC-type sugar transport system ATPase subunit
MSVVENLMKDYGDFRIAIPRWEIPDRGITALWGPSGSGKTSVFRLLMGLEPCPGLVWRFGDEDLAALDPSKRRLGVVFQNLELFPHMTAAENILFAARARGVSLQESRDRMADLTEELRITAILQRKALVLSGGEAQRVALARAVIGQPRFLFLDEPFSSLDSQMREEARGLVAHVVKRLAIPTLLVTHDQEDLKALAETVVRIKDGRLEV